MTSITVYSFIRNYVQGDESIEERAERPTARHRRRLLLNHEEKRARHAACTSLAHSIPWMLCVNTHYPTDPSRAKRPPNSEANTSHCQTLFPQSTRAKTSSANSPHQCHSWISKVLFPMVPILSCFSPGCCLQSCLLLHAFLGLLWLLNLHSPAHFCVSILYLSPSLLLRCLCTTPDRRRASQYLPGGPHLLFYAVDIDV